jgi:hypothetical protein
MKVRQLVGDVNQTVARLRAEQVKLRSSTSAEAAAELPNLTDIAGRLLTPQSATANRACRRTSLTSTA